MPLSGRTYLVGENYKSSVPRRLFANAIRAVLDKMLAFDNETDGQFATARLVIDC